MSFEVDGFFSPEIERFRQAVRTTSPYKAWFDYALGLNRIGLDLMKRASTPLADRRLFTMYGHFVRTQQTFQGALLLAERGMVSNARILLRSGVESAIAICALAKDDSLVDEMIAAHHLNQRKYARLVVNNPNYCASYSAQEIVEMHATIATVDAIEATSGKKLKEINWADTAAAHCFDLYHLLYRTLSHRTALTPPSTLSIGCWKSIPANRSRRSRWRRTLTGWSRRLARPACCSFGQPILSPRHLIVPMYRQSYRDSSSCLLNYQVRSRAVRRLRAERLDACAGVLLTN